MFSMDRSFVEGELSERMALVGCVLNISLDLNIKLIDICAYSFINTFYLVIQQ